MESRDEYYLAMGRMTAAFAELEAAVALCNAFLLECGYIKSKGLLGMLSLQYQLDAMGATAYEPKLDATTRKTFDALIKEISELEEKRNQAVFATHLVGSQDRDMAVARFRFKQNRLDIGMKHVTPEELEVLAEQAWTLRNTLWHLLEELEKTGLYKDRSGILTRYRS